MSRITPFCIHGVPTGEEIFTACCPISPIINLSQLLMEDCKVLWDPSGWKVLVVTVTRHRLALGHSHSLILLGLLQATTF